MNVLKAGSTLRLIEEQRLRETALRIILLTNNVLFKIGHSGNNIESRGNYLRIAVSAYG